VIKTWMTRGFPKIGDLFFTTGFMSEILLRMQEFLQAEMLDAFGSPGASEAIDPSAGGIFREGRF
jgi:hypothetical protein